MAISVPREVSKKYIEGYFKRAYPISEEIQPYFWKTVEILCENKEADVSTLINEENFCCTNNGISYYHVSQLAKGVKNVTELAEKIAEEIIKSETTSVKAVDFYLMQKDVERLKKSVDYIKSLFSRDC